ncbi:MAG TPA: DNA repair protein RecO [Pyrinomonadaceae bacterium]|nr:DNA repair protein RecO [Pyrinomonadaceae bacterium]
MGVSETEAIVLRTYKLAEADKITVFLSQNSGVMRGVARGARRLKSKFGAALEPFTLVSLSYFEKEGQELVSIRQAEILRSYFELSKNTEVVVALEYIGGLILEFTPPHEPNEKIFRMIRACLEAIASAPENLRHITRYCEVWLLKLSGFLPDLRACVNCKKPLGGNRENSYLGADGALRCGECAHKLDLPVSFEATAHLRATQRLAPGDWGLSVSTVSEAVLKELSQITQRLITRALERLPRGRATVE